MLPDVRRNDELLLECGELWDEPAAASVPLRMFANMEGGYDKGEQAGRTALLRRAKLNETADFRLRHGGGIPARMQLWSRIYMAEDEEVAQAVHDGDGKGPSLAPFRKPMSQRTEDEVHSYWHTALNNIRARFEHDVDEDELLLSGGVTTRQAKDREMLTGGGGGGPLELSVRAQMAVRNRRLSKLVLDDALAWVSRSYKAEEARRQALPQGDARAGGGGGGGGGGGQLPAASSSAGGYSTSRLRKREERARLEKERKREEVRKRREAKKKEREFLRSRTSEAAAAKDEMKEEL